MKTTVIAVAFLLGACGGQSAADSTGGSAGVSGTGGGSSGGAGGSSAGAGGSGASSGAGGVAGAGASAGAGGSAGDACNDPSLKLCNGPGQCALTTSDCCLCGMPEITDYVAMNQASAAKCDCGGPVCDCASAPNPNLAASCESGTCAAWDVRQRKDYAGCADDTDCRLRNGLDCCEGCQASNYSVVAVRKDAESALKAALCEGGSACSKCMVQYPSTVTAVCNAGSCQVMYIK